MTNLNRLRAELLSLPRSERASLLHELLASLDDDLDDGASPWASPEIAAAWAEECVRRSRAFATGQTTASDWRESVAEIQQRLDERMKQRDSADVRQ